jgi:cytochrome P450
MSTAHPQAPPELPDLFDPTTVRDPFEAYASYRRIGPVYDERNGCWILARHHDVVEALHQPALLSSQGGFRALMGGSVGPPAARGRGAAVGLDEFIGSRVLIASDPPDHTKLRRLVSRPFTKGAMAAWQPRIAARAEEVIDEFVQRLDAGDADLVRDLAIPLPVLVIADVLDIPAERLADFRRWSDALVGTLGGDVDLAAAQVEIQQMFEFFFDLAQLRRQDPGDDLISAIAVAEPDGEALDPLEVVMFCVLLLVAGNETTTNLLGNLQEALWAYPDEADLLASRPELVSATIEEALRFCGPVQGLFRATTEPCTFGAVTIPADQIVMVLFASANRDEKVFPAGDIFQIERDSRDHVAFGHGVHYCLGAQLARLETAEALRVLSCRTVTLAPNGPASRTTNPILRGFTSLPVSRVSPTTGPPS